MIPPTLGPAPVPPCFLERARAALAADRAAAAARFRTAVLEAVLVGWVSSVDVAGELRTVVACLELGDGDGLRRLLAGERAA